MVLEGVVNNVPNFGAFVNVRVHQDGLVHISAIAQRFVKNPREVVKAGDVVRVKVLEVDSKRRRIALSMRATDQPAETGGNRPPSPPKARGKPVRAKRAEPTNAMAAVRRR